MYASTKTTIFVQEAV